jgi:catechol O-methyltransferase
MAMWRFFLPSALGFTTTQAVHTAIDKLRGAPARTAQAATYVAENALKGDPRSVLETLDRFSTEVRWLMSVGPKKGPLIQEMVDRLPTNARILELGAYCGYSSILIASTFGPQCQVTSIEISPEAVASSLANVEMAGLSGQVTFIQGSSTDVLAELEGSFDLVFLDHWKDLYKTDLELIESRDLIKPGSIVIADNVGKVFDPGTYLEYVRNCGHYESENRSATIEYTEVPDAVEISVFQPREIVGAG